MSLSTYISFAIPFPFASSASFAAGIGLVVNLCPSAALFSKSNAGLEPFPSNAAPDAY